jgi:dTDP-4-dehydrorhamnose reductase
MKVLITGGSGQLGEFLNIEFSRSEHTFLSLYNSRQGNCADFTSAKIDLKDENSVKEIFINFNPDVVIHTAAISNAAKCDASSKAEVFDINFKATGMLAYLCEEFNSKIIFTSTDLVYDGKQGSMLREDAGLNPLSLYAESKLEAEESIKNLNANFIILRTALLFGTGISNNENYFHKVYDSFSAGNKMKLFSDQFRTPLALHDAARLIKEMTEKNISGETINFGGNKRVSRAELGEILCDTAGFDKNLIQSVKMDEISLKDNVPDVSMDNSKLRSYGIRPEEIEDSVRKIIDNINSRKDHLEKKR